MSLNNTTFRSASSNKAHTISLNTEQIPHYIICVGLGGLSGVLGVAIVIGTVLIHHLFFTQATELIVGFVPLMILAALMSCGVAWLMTIASRRLIRSLATHFNEQSWQIILIISILTSLIQFPLFMHSL